MQSDYIEEFALAKLNLSFKVLKKLPNNFHQIESYITFLPNIYDHLIIKKSLQNKIVINGKFANQLIANGGDTLIKKSIKLLSNLLISYSIPLIVLYCCSLIEDNNATSA